LKQINKPCQAFLSLSGDNPTENLKEESHWISFSLSGMMIDPGIPEDEHAKKRLAGLKRRVVKACKDQLKKEKESRKNRKSYNSQSRKRKIRV
jgi:hypothetical protein